MIDPYKTLCISEQQLGIPFTFWFIRENEYVGLCDIKRTVKFRVADKNNITILCGFLYDKFTTFYMSKDKLDKVGDLSELKQFVTRCKYIIKLYWHNKLSDNELTNLLIYMAKNEDADIVEAADYSFDKDLISGDTWKRIHFNNSD